MNFKIDVNMTMKDIINAATASKSVKSFTDPVTVTGIAIVEDGGTDRNKQPCDVGYIATDVGTFGFISGVMLKNLPLLAEYLKDCLDNGDDLPVIKFITGKTKDEQEFYSFEVQ